jgi:hypothetical protein
MHLDLSWVFSIFNLKVPKISRAVSGSDFRLRGNFRHLWRACYFDRNVRSRRDPTYSIPTRNLKTEPLASTSASIVKAGLNEVWRTNLKAPSRPSEHGSQVPSVPHQKHNEKPCPKASQHGRIPQPTIAPILTHLPFPQTSQRESYISADPQHPSGFRFFSLQKAVNKEPDSEQSIVRPPKLETSGAFSPVPQPAAVPLRNRIPIFSFGSSAAKGLESTQRNVGLDLFTAGQYSSSISSLQVTLFDLLPNTVQSPSQSLLFRPPSPPPKRKIIFNPEEDTVPLPPAPESKSNQFGPTYPVRSPDHEFPINTLPSPSLPTGNVHSLVPFTYS